jgi:ribonuclease BN (tRNA processing enzyme)
MHRNLLILTGLICVSCGGPSPTTSKVCPRQAGARQTSASPAGLISRLQARTHVVLLGTGTPNADPTRQGPALAVVVKGTPYLVDCGPGLVRRAAQANKKGIRALAVKNLGRVFLTHLHSDHTAGFPDLLYTPWVLGRNAPLQVYGPPGTSRFVKHITQAYKEDVAIRLGGLEPANDRGHRVSAVEFAPGFIYRDKRVTVQAFAVRHGAWKHAYGLRFITPDLHVCVSGDTRPFAGLARAYAGCDILLHEVYSQIGFRRRNKTWQRYHAAGHTSAPALGRIASQVKPGLLVLIHQLRWGTSERDLVGEVRQHHRGQVVSGNDLMVIGLSSDYARPTPGRPGRGKISTVQLQ